MALRAFAVYHRSVHDLRGIGQGMETAYSVAIFIGVTGIAVQSTVRADPARQQNVQCLFKVIDDRRLG